MGRLANDAADFLESRKADGFAATTIRNYRKDLRVMQRALGNPLTGSITASDIDKVMALASETMSAASVNGVQANLSSFFKWCRSRGRVQRDHDPLAGRRYRKVPRKEYRRIPVAEFPVLLDAAVNARDRMVIALGLYLMLRQSEIADLKIGDVDLQSGQIQVRIFKTNDLDSMPISKELDGELRSWLTTYSEAAGMLQHDWYLVPSRSFSGRYADRDALGRIVAGQLGLLRPKSKMTHVEHPVQMAMEAIGYPSQDSNGKSLWSGVHTLRRSSARAMFDELSQAGYDGALRTVQAWLHHASSTMTERYLGLEIDRSVRNKKFAGQAMFASLDDTNVVKLEVVHGERDNLAV